MLTFFVKIGKNEAPIAIDWHVGKEIPTIVKKERVIKLQADGDELEIIMEALDKLAILMEELDNVIRRH